MIKTYLEMCVYIMIMVIDIIVAINNNYIRINISIIIDRIISDGNRTITSASTSDSASSRST